MPDPEDVFLVAEVADSTFDHDRRKAWFYANAGIEEYWLLNLDSDPFMLTVYRDPAPDGYHTLRHVRAGDQLSPLAFPDVAVDTNVLLR